MSYVANGETFTAGDLQLTVRVNPRTKSYIMRRRADGLLITVPPLTTHRQLDDAVKNLLPRLLKKPAPPRCHYSEGDTIDTPFTRFIVTRQSTDPLKIKPMRARDGLSTLLCVGSGIDISSGQTTKTLTSMMMHISRPYVQQTLIPEARRTALRLGCNPAGWKVGYGLRTLGTCSSRGVITLSAAIAFLPAHLQHYIICHELAHLRHLNHSPEFHALCNEYCNGHETSLRAELKKHRWSLIVS